MRSGSLATPARSSGVRPDDTGDDGNSRRLTRSVEGSFSVLGRNGFVAAGASPEFGPTSVAGYAFDGTELWHHPVVAGGRPLTLLPGAIVTVETAASGAATLTLLS
jgi:hypothetical protein